MKEVFRVRLERKFIRQASEVATEIGTSPGEIVRLLFKQLVKRRAVPFYEVTFPRVPWLREQSYCNAQSVQPVAWTEFQRKVGQFEAAL